MLIWGAVWGAILAMLWSKADVDYLVSGALLGLAIGWTLQRAVRTAVRKEIEQSDQDLAPSHRRLQQKPPEDRQKATPEELAAAQELPPGAHFDSEPSHRRDEHEDDLADLLSAPPAPAVRAAAEPPQVAAGSTEPVFSGPAAPRTPGAWGQTLDSARTWLLGGNLIVRVGITILFIGLAMLARFAAQTGLMPAELRLTGIGAMGVALLTFGFRKRASHPAFGLVLQGGGVAVLYLTAFAAFRLYHLVPQLAAFGFMVLVCALGCALALLQNARSLASAAFAGGFATPLLLSTGSGSHVLLFGYYTLLNLAILFIATRRTWRELNLLGLLTTFGTAGAWGMLSYGTQDYATVQGFLMGFILIFIATAILYARGTRLQLGAGTVSHAVDTTLVFGTPLLGFGLQAGLVHHLPYGDAFSALGFGALYLVLALVLQGRSKAYQVLTESFLALGVGFATLAIPLALGAQWTSSIWALEGAAAFWVGMRQARWLPRAFGLVLQALAVLTYLASLETPVSSWPLNHGGFVGALLIAAAALATAWWARRPLPHADSRWAKAYAPMEALLSTPLLLYGTAMWMFGWMVEMTRRLPPELAGAAAQLAWTHPAANWIVPGVGLLSAAALLHWGRRTGWAAATWPSRLSLPALTFTLLSMSWLSLGRPLPGIVWMGWPLALGLHMLLLRTNEHPSTPGLSPAWQRWLAWQHVGTVWLTVLLLGDLLRTWIAAGKLFATAWASVIGVAAYASVLLLLTLWFGRANRNDTLHQFAWPLNPHAQRYYWHAALPLALLLIPAILALAVSSSGRTAPLPYIPLLNPTDLVLLLALTTLLLWRQAVLTAHPQPIRAASWLRPALFWAVLGALGLLVLSTVWLRVAHHFFGVPWNAYALYRSFIVQTGYAILWTLAALALMIGAHRRGQRPAWLSGAALLGLVVVKLILIDLSNRGGGERIVAFIGVGVLMLVVGYFAPLPPKPGTTDERDESTP